MSNPSIGPPESELALRQAFRRGERHAFAELAGRHADEIYTVCLRILGRPEAAEDAAQDTLVKALRAHAAYDVERSFRPWILTIAANTCRDRVRTVWWARVGEILRPAAAADDLELELEAMRRDREVRNALARLPPKYREALALFHLRDMTYLEMSDITGVTVFALKQRVRRGKAMLRERVEHLSPSASAIRTQDT